jgi:hypothetical protein
MATIDTFVTPILKVDLETPDPAPPDLGGRAFVTLQDDERAIVLDPKNPRYRLYRRILAGFAADQIIAFLDVDRDTRELRALSIPVTGGASAVDQLPTGEVVVQLVGSSRIFVLKPTEPGFIGKRQILKDAFAEPAVVSIRLRPFSDEISDVRRVGPFEGPARTQALKFDAELIATLPMFQESVVRKLFDFLAGEICDPKAILNPCLPFHYPDDGCQGRAHVMCDKLLHASRERPDLPDVISGKIWHHGLPNQAYEVQTSNSPACKVKWLFHCAPIVRVTNGTTAGALRVLDPSLFDGPKTPEEWERRQTTVGTRQISDKAVFYRRRPDSAIFFDRLNDNARRTVSAARALFDERVEDNGPPPYRCRP